MIQGEITISRENAKIQNIPGSTETNQIEPVSDVTTKTFLVAL